MVAEKGKKSKVVERAEGEDSVHIDSQLVQYIEKLQEVQDELEKVNEEAGDKVLEIEQIYNEIRRPVYNTRNEIIKTIPDFWLTAFLSHPALCDLLNDEDQKIFKYLDSLDVEDFKDVKSGYSITFNFNENPYFEDPKLTKTFIFFGEGTTKITGTTIKWKEDTGASNGVNHEEKGNKRPRTDVAEIIKEDLWPNPLKYFNNEADEEDSDGDEGDEEENGEDDEQDDDDGNEGDS
ncbi:nap1-related protein 2 [Quercus suber]|uniref:Nap1-related protein 2 n=1 Tax=Quercus suber TaxID=58331 RepID=A0AAW0MBM2_QUESU